MAAAPRQQGCGGELISPSVDAACSSKGCGESCTLCDPGQPCAAV